MDLADLRDIVVIVYGVLGILLFLILIGITVALWLVARQLRGMMKDLIAESVKPTLDHVNQTAQNVRGASDFMVDRAVHPLIRTMQLPS